MTGHMKELEAMQEAFALLEPFDVEARTRVISWLSGALDVRSGSPPRQGLRTGPGADATIDGSFGEQLQELTPTASGMDQMLLAGLHVQEVSDDTAFSTKEANALLIEQGIKVGNPSQTMTNNLNAKRAFRVGKKYRVSKQGAEHLAALLEQE